MILLNRILGRPSADARNVQAIEDASKIVRAYGAAIAARQTTYGDEALLPYAKSVIKMSLKIILAATMDEATRVPLEFAYMDLASWQPGVPAGPEPHLRQPGESIEAYASRITSTKSNYMEVAATESVVLAGELQEMAGFSRKGIPK